jgi:hypothetical protein
MRTGNCHSRNVITIKSQNDLLEVRQALSMPKPVAARVLMQRPCMSFGTDCYPVLAYIDLKLSTVASHVSAERRYRMAGGLLSALRPGRFPVAMASCL